MKIIDFVEQLMKLKKIKSITFRNRGGYNETCYLNNEVSFNTFYKNYKDFEINDFDFEIKVNKHLRQYSVIVTCKDDEILNKTFIDRLKNEQKEVTEFLNIIQDRLDKLNKFKTSKNFINLTPIEQTMLSQQRIIMNESYNNLSLYNDILIDRLNYYM